MNNKWYVLQVFSGSEDKVLKYIKNYSKSLNLNNSFNKILIPKEEIIEIKNGKKIKSERRIFPGYIFINMNINNDIINMINNIKNVLGFIKNGLNISYISNNEIDKILDKIKFSYKNPKPKISFNLGETIRINDGPFSDFNGIVENVDYLKNRITISVSIFGRHTPVELNFIQVEKLI